MNNGFTEKNLSNGNYLSFQKYGVKIGIQTDYFDDSREIRHRLEKIFPNGVDYDTIAEVEYFFVIKRGNAPKKAERLELYLNGEKLVEEKKRDTFFDFTESRLRLTIAEFASGKVFLHAGVVGWKGKALILPGISFSGKTTLVAELIKRGAEYYSDEYAVLDANGDVEPFPKWLSVRGIIDEWTQVDRSVEEMGGIAAERTIVPGMILFSKYRPERRVPKKWQPRRLKQAEAMMELLPHTLPIRNNPKFVLEVLNKLTNRAIIVRTLRGEAVEFAVQLLKYFDLQTKKQI